MIFEVGEVGNYGLGMWLSSMNKATFEQKAGNQPRHQLCPRVWEAEVIQVQGMFDLHSRFVASQGYIA